MPIVYVNGMPGGILNLRELGRRIREAVAVIPELGLTPEQTTVFMPQDMVADGKEIIVRVMGLFAKAERTTTVRQKLAAEIATVVGVFLPGNLEGCELVEVLIDPPYDTDAMGFARIEFS